MKRSLTRRAALGFAALLIASCASKTPPPATSISDQDLARVPSSGMEAVNARRTLLGAARDTQHRADIAIDDTRKDLATARADVSVAQAKRDRAEKARDAASAAGDPARSAAANKEKNDADEALKTARAKVALLETKLDADKAERDATAASVKAAEADLEIAKLEALKASGNLKAERYSRPDFEARLKTSRQEEENARDRANRETERYAKAKRDFQERTGVGGTGKEQEQETPQESPEE